MMISEMKLIEEFRDLSMNVEVTPEKLCFGMVTVSSDLIGEIKAKQLLDAQLAEKRNGIPLGKAPDFEVGSDGVLRCK